MFRNDFIVDGIQKLALLLAKLLGLKQAGKQAEFVQLAESTALKEYDIALDVLLAMPVADFEAWLLKQSMAAGKLDALAGLLYLYAEPFESGPDTLSYLHKILTVYDMLEQKHRRQSLENINRRKQIEEFMERSLPITEY